MRYISTRGEAPVLGFEDVLLAGLAADGGLYVPVEWPHFSENEIAALQGLPYAELAFAVMRPFLGGEIADADVRAMIGESYAGFSHPAVTPLVQSGTDEWILELHRGPTLAFKDLAMQVLARMMDHVLTRRDARATIVCATSGDTGGAAVDAFAGRDRTDLFVLLPKGRVSDVQRRMMTTNAAANVHALEIDGNFDDCQAIVKAMFAHESFRSRVALSGVNSINWARIVAQTVYYFSAALALGGARRQVNFTVPTGNFGDIFAGFVAKKMGLPIGRLIVATNVNDILARTFEKGRHEKAGVVATSSPSMDIQVSSNFERLLFELTGRDAQTVRRLMDGLAQSGGFDLPDPALAALRAEFDAGRADENETAELQRRALDDQDLCLDPHTAVALHVARRSRTAGPMVVLSTAHPAKFPDAVAAATGQRPALPPAHRGLMERPETSIALPNDVALVEDHILKHSRIGQGS